MCGRYTLRTPAAQLIQLFDVPDMPMLAPRYNIAPTQMVVCVRTVPDQPSSREAVSMRWGLIPFWARDKSIGNQMINARGETVAEKPAFRNSFAKRRCLILADGFFEWQKLTTGKKQPWLIEMDDKQPFAMAGLWESWTPRDSSQGSGPVISCSIITTEANDDMKPLHDRMPVILPIEVWTMWLSSQASAGQLQDLLRSLPDGLLTCTSVSTVVNKPFPDNADCIVPTDAPEPLMRTAAASVGESTGDPVDDLAARNFNNMDGTVNAFAADASVTPEAAPVKKRTTRTRKTDGKKTPRK